MAYQLDDGESLPEGIRRIVTEQVDGALGELEGRTDDPPDEAVHLARKRLKRIRAVLRLVRAELGPEVFARENVAYRDIGRLLSGVRDAAVLVKTFDAVVDGEELAGGEAVRAALVDRHGTLRERALADGAASHVARTALTDARERIAGWPLRWDGFFVIEDGLRRIYAQGGRRMALALHGEDAEQWHEWRKRVKDLWHQVQVLTCMWPAGMEALADETHRLSDVLGDEHDLAVLQATLVDEGLGADGSAAAVLALADARRAVLQTAAGPLGARLYAEPPSAFMVRMAAYWDAWRS